MSAPSNPPLTGQRPQDKDAGRVDRVPTVDELAGIAPDWQAETFSDAAAAGREETVAKTALAALPCRCADAHTRRGLTAPDCPHHDLADALEQFWVCDCAACARTRGVARR